MSQQGEARLSAFHLDEEALSRLSREDVLKAALQTEALLDLLIGILRTPETSLVLRAVTMDLLFDEAARQAQHPQADQAGPVTYNIKEISTRLGIRPAAVREALEQLDALGGVHILARRFPRARRQQPPLPLDEMQDEGHK